MEQIEKALYELGIDPRRLDGTYKSEDQILEEIEIVLNQLM